MIDSLKQNRVVMRTAWLTGKALNHHVPKLTARSDDRSPVESRLPLPDASVGTEQGIIADAELATLPSTGRTDSTRYNPVITSDDVSDYGQVDFVADPFLYPGDDRWHLFFEVFNRDRDPDALIGHATSTDGIDWTYNGVVLNTGKHLSFPFVFEWQGRRYMLPETGGAGDTVIELYEAVEFPSEWRRCAVPVSNDHDTDDAVVFRWNDRWWLMVGDDSISGTYLYHSRSIDRDGWTPHPGNPVVFDRPAASRPGGRPIVSDDCLMVFFQDCSELYGECVRAYEITALDRSTYEDRELLQSPILEGTGARFGWNSGRMHHIDPYQVGGRWICAVDGNVRYSNLFTNDHWSIGLYMSESN